MNIEAFSQKDKVRLIRKGNGFEFTSQNNKEIAILMKHLRYMRENGVESSLRDRLQNKLNAIVRQL